MNICFINLTNTIFIPISIAIGTILSSLFIYNLFGKCNPKNDLTLTGQLDFPMNNTNDNTNDKNNIIIKYISDNTNEQYYISKLNEIFLNKHNKPTQNNEPTQIYNPNTDTNKIHIDFLINNKEYSINIIGEINKKHHSFECIQNIITNAELCSNNSHHSNINITNLLKKYQGPNYDFYENLSGVSFQLNDILYDLIDYSKYNKLHIKTILEEINIEISETTDVRYLFMI